MAIVKKSLSLAFAALILTETNSAMEVAPYRPSGLLEHHRDGRKAPKPHPDASLWHYYLMSLINKVPDLMSHLTLTIYNNLSPESKQKMMNSMAQIAFWGSMIGTLAGTAVATYRHYVRHVPVTNNIGILAAACLITLLGSGAYLAGNKGALNPNNSSYVQVNLTFENHERTSSCSSQLNLFSDLSQEAETHAHPEQHALLELQQRKIRTVLQYVATGDSLLPAFINLNIGFYRPASQQEKKPPTSPTTGALIPAGAYDSSCKNCTPYSA
jgi:hypothetical protein